MKKLENTNKKLNKDYFNLSNDYKIMKEEKEKLKSIIDEQNATIFNYEKQLNTNNSSSKNNYYRNNLLERLNNYNMKTDKNYYLNDYKKEFMKEKNNEFRSEEKNKNYEYNLDKYSDTINPKNNRENYNYENNLRYINTNRNHKNKYSEVLSKEKILSHYKSENDFNGIKYNYQNYSSYNMNEDNNLMKYTVEKNKKFKKGELNYLENYLSTLLKERAQLENNISEIPEHPRTLKDIKLKNSLKDKITQSDKEIFNIQQQLKKLRGN